MSPFPDASFLYALYRKQDNSSLAISRFSRLVEPLTVSSLLLLELRQSVRFQAGLHRQDKAKGFSQTEARQVMAHLGHDLDLGTLHVVSVEWVAIHTIADKLSEKYTTPHLHRLVDILHVATALHLGVREFLTFDANQKRLALAEGLKVSP